MRPTTRRVGSPRASEPLEDRLRGRRSHDQDEPDPDIERLVQLVRLDRPELTDPCKKSLRLGPAVEHEPDLVVETDEVSDPAAADVGEAMDARVVGHGLDRAHVDPGGSEELLLEAHGAPGPPKPQLHPLLVDEPPDQRVAVRMEPARGDPDHLVARTDRRCRGSAAGPWGRSRWPFLRDRSPRRGPGRPRSLHRAVRIRPPAGHGRARDRWPRAPGRADAPKRCSRRGRTVARRPPRGRSRSPRRRPRPFLPIGPSPRRGGPSFRPCRW